MMVSISEPRTRIERSSARYGIFKECQLRYSWLFRVTKQTFEKTRIRQRRSDHQIHTADELYAHTQNESNHHGYEQRRTIQHRLGTDEVSRSPEAVDTIRQQHRNDKFCSTSYNDGTVVLFPGLEAMRSTHQLLVRHPAPRISGLAYVRCPRTQLVDKGSAEASNNYAAACSVQTRCGRHGVWRQHRGQDNLRSRRWKGEAGDHLITFVRGHCSICTESVQT